MKHSTFYKIKGKKKIYTTIKDTDYHKFLRDDHKGKTYQHTDNAKLYFIYPDMPLDRPM